MRRDKTLKVCANHVSEYSHNHPPCCPGRPDCYIVSTDMRLQPNIGSDRSWVWKVAADYSEQPPTSETLAIRFANSESESCDSCILRHRYISFLQTLPCSRLHLKRAKNPTRLQASPTKQKKNRRNPKRMQQRAMERPKRKRIRTKQVKWSTGCPRYSLLQFSLTSA